MTESENMLDLLRERGELDVVDRKTGAKRTLVYRYAYGLHGYGVKGRTGHILMTRTTVLDWLGHFDLEVIGCPSCDEIVDRLGPQGVCDDCWSRAERDGAKAHISQDLCKDLKQWLETPLDDLLKRDDRRASE